MKIFFTIITTLFLFGCAGTNYKSLATNDPVKLIAMQDSLLKSGIKNPPLLQALTQAHNEVGLKALYVNDLKMANKHFQESLSFSPKDTTAQYYQWITQGRLLMKTGKKNKIWDAIELFGKCDRLFPENGEHHYWTGRAYYKIGDKDFDLILEAFLLATKKSLPHHLAEKAKIELKKQNDRKKKFADFWM